MSLFSDTSQFAAPEQMEIPSEDRILTKITSAQLPNGSIVNISWPDVEDWYQQADDLVHAFRATRHTEDDFLDRLTDLRDSIYKFLK